MVWVWVVNKLLHDICSEEDGKCAHTEEKDDVGPTANQIQCLLATEW